MVIIYFKIYDVDRFVIEIDVFDKTRMNWKFREILLASTVEKFEVLYINVIVINKHLAHDDNDVAIIINLTPITLQTITNSYPISHYILIILCLFFIK